MLTLDFLPVGLLPLASLVDYSLFKRLMYHIRRVEKDVEEFSGKQIHIPIYIMASQVNRQEIEENILSMMNHRKSSSYFLTKLYYSHSTTIMGWKKTKYHFSIKEPFPVLILKAISSCKKSTKYNHSPFILTVDCPFSRWEWRCLFCITSLSYCGKPSPAGS